jgi:hypothetical protein
MRIVEISTAAAVALLAWAIPEAVRAETLQEYQAKHNLTATDIEELKQLLAQSVTKPAKKASTKSPSNRSAFAAGLATKSPTIADSAAPAAAAGHATLATSSSKASSSPNGSWQFLLRQDWQDIGVLAIPTPVDKATGASISYSNDGIAKDETWATHATGAIVYQLLNDQGPGQTTPFWETFASYATVNKLYNSNPKLASKNIDTLAGGGAIELGYDDAKAETQNYFQFLAGAVQDNIKNTTSVNATAAWIPANVNYHIHSPSQLFGIFGYRFEPEFLAQYASTTDPKNVLLFSDRDQSFRIGPQLSLIFFPYVTSDSPWSNLSANILYHWWYEAYDGSEKHWMKAQVVYNLDKTGNFALTGSYQQGNDETTGQPTNLFMVSLSGKN